MANKPHRLMYRFWLDITKPAEETIADKIEILKNDRAFTKTIRDGIRLVCDLRNGKLDVLFELFPWVRAEFMEYMRDLQITTQQPETTPVPQPVTQSPQQMQAEKDWLAAEQERIEAERKWHEKRVRDAERALEAEREKIDQERKHSQNAIQQQLERLEQLLLNQGNQPISSGLQPLSSGAGGNPKPANAGLASLNAPQFSVPTYDDEDDDDIIGEVKKAKGSTNAALNYIKSMQALQQ